MTIQDRRTALGAALAASLLLLPSLARPLAAQGIAERMAGVGNGTVELSYTTRPGVCGDGDGMLNMGGGHIRMSRNDAIDSDWRAMCEPGPARVRLELRGGEPVAAELRVGPRARSLPAPTLDLGRVPAPAAASYFLSLAARAGGRVAEQAIVAAEVADSATVWPQLLRIAQDDSRPRGVHGTAMFWLGQEVADRLAPRDSGADDTPSDAEAVKRSAVFALSQQAHHEGVPMLIDVARHNHDPAVRRQAVFWLGQSGDPRGLEFFQQVLQESRAR